MTNTISQCRYTVDEKKIALARIIRIGFCH